MTNFCTFISQFTSHTTTLYNGSLPPPTSCCWLFRNRNQRLLKRALQFSGRPKRTQSCLHRINCWQEPKFGQGSAHHINHPDVGIKIPTKKKKGRRLPIMADSSFYTKKNMLCCCKLDWYFIRKPNIIIDNQWSIFAKGRAVWSVS